MKSYNIKFSPKALNNLPIDTINKKRSTLIQIFTSSFEKEKLQNVFQLLQKTFPKATIIGTTTAGEILERDIFDGETVVSITTFSNTTLRYIHIEDISIENSHQRGIELAQKYLKKESKAMILFGDTFHIDGDAFLQGIHKVSKEVIIAGGMAGFEENSQSLFLVSNQGITQGGLVGVVLDNKDLKVYTDYQLNWMPIGKKLKITHAVGNRIYSIDHVKAAQIYKYYLGDEVYESLPTSGLHFPLISSQKGVHIARTPIIKHEDDSLELAGAIHNEEEYQIGFGNLEFMIKDRSLSNRVADNAIESIFIYSCIGRKSFMQDQVIKEIAPLSQAANVSGFFTFGEFYKNKEHCALLNQTMTILGLSEHVTPPSNKRHLNKESLRNPHLSTINALSHFITVSNNELQSYQEYLSLKEKLLAGGPVVNFKIKLKNHTCTYISHNVESILGYSAKEILNNEVSLYDLVDESYIKKLRHQFLAFTMGTEIAYESEVKIYTKNKEEKYLHLYLAMEKDKEHKINHIVGYFIDITKRVESQKQIHKLAYYDQLTNLPNREFLKRRLEEVVQSCRYSDKICAVSFMDLNKFKDVNDTYGHSAGDKLLQLVSNRLRTCIKEEDVIARIGGDEFIILHTNLNKSSAYTTILSISNRAIRLIEEPFDIDGKIAHISTSIGTAVYGIDGENAEDLIKYADIAMYQAKSDPHHKIKFYSNSMRQKRLEEITLLNDLKEAVRNKEFILLYQPQIDIKKGHIDGAEALIRWVHPQRGMISPAKFIPLAEKHHLINTLGEWIIEEVCHKISYLQSMKNLPKNFKTIAVNISPIQFRDPHFVAKVEKIVTLLNIDTKYLEFELTEGMFSNEEDIEEMIAKMHQIKKLGITLSLDDFGTGYSSLQYLKKMPFDIIKIDRAFISNLQSDKKDQILTSTIIQLSKNLRYKLVAEGVENLEQLLFLEENNCDSYQGYFFSKPLIFEAFETLLQKELTFDSETACYQAS